MNNRYEICFTQSINAYTSQSNRPGYLFGWLSSWRHSKTLYPHIADLQTKLAAAHSDDDAKKVLQEYFRHRLTKFNNHSFALYLLDSLLMTCPTEKHIWEQYYPPEKKLIFYTGTLYRGMRIDEGELKIFFANGLEARESSKWVDDYAKDTTMGLGISTSTDKSIAQGYATRIISRGLRESCQMIHISGYLLKMNYRGPGGIKLFETLQARGENMNAYLSDSKREINIVGRIEPSDIEGAWYVGQDEKKLAQGFIKNPNYMAVKPMSANDDMVLPERLRKLFTS